MSEAEGRKLVDLRVVDLKAELEKRGLDKNGVKKDLVERLTQALENDGHDVETYNFELGDKKPPKRLSTSSSQQSDDKNEIESDTKQDEAAKDQNHKGKDVADEETVKVMDDSVDENASEHDALDKKSEQGDRINLTLDDEDNIKDDNTDDLAETAETNHNSDVKAAPKDSSGDEEAKESPTSDAPQQEKKSEVSATANNSGGKEESSTKKSQANPRLLWITNVPKNTRANEIKQLLATHGKVVCAKVVVNARFPGSCCFGYVTMGSPEDALNVIAKLNNTEFNGQIIKIDKFENVKGDSLNQRKSKEESKDDSGDKKSVENTEKGVDESDDTDKKVPGNRECPERRKSRTSDRSSRGGKRSTPSRDRIRERPHPHLHPQHRPNNPFYRGNVLTFNKIKEERERQRMRDRERAMREDSRRRHEEAVHLREMRQISRRQRSEAERLEREREKLRQERDRIEREKSELIKLERERQRIEREKLEMERLELQRSRLRLEEDRRTVKRPGPSVPFRRENTFEHERKRPAPERHFEEPPPPRFEPPTETPSKKFAPSKDFKRVPYEKPSFPEKRGREYGSERPHQGLNRSSNASTKYDRSYVNVRHREPPAREPQSAVSIRSKDSRYAERDRSPHFRPLSDSRDRHVPQGKSDRDHHYADSNASDRWGHSVTSQPKSFISNSQKPWTSSKGPSWRPDEPTGDRWNASSSTSRTLSQSFNNNSSVGPACPPPPGINNYSDRFEYNKSSNRKY